MCTHFLTPHLSFLDKVLNMEMCGMGVPNSWIDERQLDVGAELEACCTLTTSKQCDMVDTYQRGMV